MRHTPLGRVLAVAVATTAAVAAVLRVLESRGGTILPVPVLAWVAVLAIALVVAALGWNVRQYKAGKRPEMDMLLAARTVVLATASAYTGALLTGWYAAQVLVVIGDLDVSARRDVAITAGVAAISAVVLGVVGLLVERWCEVPPPDDDEGGPTPASGTPA